LIWVGDDFYINIFFPFFVHQLIAVITLYDNKIEVVKSEIQSYSFNKSKPWSD
jgi:hypothetical protein